MPSDKKAAYLALALFSGKPAGHYGFYQTKASAERALREASSRGGLTGRVKRELVSAELWEKLEK